MAQKLISQGTLKTDFGIGINNGPILALEMSKEAFWVWLPHYVRSFTKIIDFHGTVDRFKSRYFSVMKYFGFDSYYWRDLYEAL